MSNSNRRSVVPGRLVSALAQLRPARSTVLWGTLLVNVELFMLLTYASVTESRLTPYVVYPLVWITVSLWVFVRIRPAAATGRRRLIAVSIGILYFLLLMALTGHIATGVAFVDTSVYTGLRLVFDRPPGMSPALHYVGTSLSVQLIPFYVAGYAALSYLVYMLVLDVSRFALGGLLGLFSCLSCTFPVVVGLLTSTAGLSATGVAAATDSLGLGASTLVFVATVLIMAFRPIATN
jgi:hypothetical protein